MNKHNHQFLNSASVVLLPLLLLITTAIASLFFRHGAFELTVLSNSPLLIAHAVAVSVLFIAYCLVIFFARRYVTQLHHENETVSEALDAQKKQLKLEIYQHQKTSVELHKLRTQDPLTQLYNSSHCIQLLNNEIARFRRYESAFSLLVIALDNFDKINHEYGSEFADFLIKKFADLLGKQLRESDILTRYDRNNFAIIAPNTTIKDAMVFANRLCHHIEVKKIDYKSVRLEVTLSIGVVTPSSVKEVTTDNLTLVADKALRAAIEQGGNQVVELDSN